MAVAAVRSAAPSTRGVLACSPYRGGMNKFAASGHHQPVYAVASAGCDEQQLSGTAGGRRRLSAAVLTVPVACFVPGAHTTSGLAASLATLRCCWPLGLELLDGRLGRTAALCVVRTGGCAAFLSLSLLRAVGCLAACGRNM